MKTYWHTLESPEFGLAYCGITLIPAESLDVLVEWTCRNARLDDLTDLLIEAKKAGRFVILFGI